MLDSAAEPYDLSGLNVVVVDDNVFMLKLMNAMLTALGVRRVRCMRDPTEVFAQLDKQPAHLLITDILMRPIDGIELTRAIRAWGGREVPYTPIFVLSGLTDRQNVLRALDAGAHEILAKPISVRSLYARIHRTIEVPVDFVRSDKYFGPDRRTLARPLRTTELASPDIADTAFI